MNIHLKVAILVDPMGHAFGDVTAEDEVETHKRTFTELLAPAEIRFQHVWCPGSIDPGTDLVVYDFGGMLPGNDLMESNAHAIVQWAHDNPNAVVMVASGFTYRNSVQYEIEQLGMSEMFNVINDDGKLEDPIPQWFRDSFGLPSPDHDKVFEATYQDEAISILTATDSIIKETQSEGRELRRPEGYTSEWVGEDGRNYISPGVSSVEIDNNVDTPVKALLPSPGISYIETDVDEVLPEIEFEIEKDEIVNWDKEAPKEPVGYITVPVYCDWHPGVHKGKCRFKIADSMVDIMDENEKPVAHMGGAFFGYYEITFPDGTGDLTGYHINPKDFWPQFEKLHSDVKDKLPEMP
jgi:hypothetical protein